MTAQDLAAEVTGGETRSPVGPPSSRLALSQFKAAWRSGNRVDARTFWVQWPSTVVDRSMMLDLAYEEFCLRTTAGEAIESDAFAAQFPSICESLARLLTVHRFLAAQTGVLPRLEPESWPMVGETFLGFELLVELGRGALARVFLAEQLALSRRQVVVKIGLYGIEEAEIIARLEHPNIVPIYSTIEDPDSELTLICMPFRGRATLGDLTSRINAETRRSALDMAKLLDSLDQPSSEDVRPLRQRPAMSYVSAVLRWGLQIADALAYAHRHGICHQDIKPSNVLVTLDGNALLLDFNLSTGGKSLGLVGGTLPYMAPEQIAGVRDLREQSSPAASPRSDIYAWGILMIELLSGRRPFDDVAVDSPALWSELYQTRQRQADLSQLPAKLDRGVVRLLQSCIEFDEARRPATADDLKQRIAVCIERTRRQESSNRRWRGAAAVVSAALLAGAAVFSAQSSRDTREMRVALAAYHHGESQAAVNHCTLALDANPALTNALILRGHAHQLTGDLNAAMADYLSAHERARDSRLWAGIGYCLHAQNRRQEAIIHYQEAIDAGLESAAVFNNIGVLQLALNQRGAARRSFDRALALDKELPEAHLNRAIGELNQALEGHSLDKVALDDIEFAIAKARPCGEIHFVAACLYSLADERIPAATERVLAELRQAVLLGFSFAEINSNARLDRFHNTPAFRKLEQLTPLPHAVRVAQRQVDPLLSLIATIQK